MWALLLALLALPLWSQESALEARAMKAMAGELNLHALLVEQHGRLLVEAYHAGEDRSVFSLFARTRDFGPDTVHDLRSVGKSVLGLLVGLAAERGLLDLDAPLSKLMPDWTDPAASRITPRHLLAMSSGLRWQEGGPGRDDEHRLMWAWSPPGSVLRRPFAAAPGATFTYNSGGTLLLAELLSRATGRSWTTFAQTELFAPLGLRDVVWIRDFFGRPMVYTGLRLRPRDLVKLGRLLLNRGRWGDRQLLPAAWIEASFRPGLATGFEDTRYGQLWWTGTVRAGGRILPWAAAFGNGGQRLYVVPDLDLCLVTTGGDYGDRTAAHRLQALFQDLVAIVGDTEAR